MSEVSTSADSGAARGSRKRKGGELLADKPLDTKSDCFQSQCLSVVFRDKRIKISDDRLSAWTSSIGGYVSILSTSPAIEGGWYFELKVDELGDNGSGHIRVGWSTRRTRYDVPIGSDCFSYGIRDKDCARVVQACRTVYGHDTQIKSGDVIGCWIRLPKLPCSPKGMSDQLTIFPNLLCDPENPPQPEIFFGSSMGFTVNGQDLGVAFTNLVEGEFHPAVSLFGKAKVSFNFGPEFVHTPPADCEACEKLFVRKDLLRPKRRPAHFIPKALQRINS
jgi:Set1/Ash2 histone methyltransferase complex subunit ASH2